MIRHKSEDFRMTSVLWDSRIATLFRDGKKALFLEAFVIAFQSFEGGSK